MIKDIIPIIYNYFQLFLLVPFICLVAIMMTKKTNEMSGLKSLIFCWVVLLTAFVPTIIISQANILYDEMEIWSEENGKATVSSIKYGAGTIYESKVVGNEKVNIKIPYGINRKICLMAENSCKINMQIEKAGYEDSYVIDGGNVENNLMIYSNTPKMKLLFLLCIKVFMVTIITFFTFEILKYIQYLIKICSKNKHMFERGGGIGMN